MYIRGSEEEDSDWLCRERIYNFDEYDLGNVVNSWKGVVFIRERFTIVAVCGT